jgi:hypothetical protein
MNFSVEQETKMCLEPKDPAAGAPNPADVSPGPLAR